MCGLAEYSTNLIWFFLSGSVVMAVLARKLNDHLLVAPKPDTSIIFRKKIHIKPTYFLKPDLYFDAKGCQWAWRFTLVASFSGAAFLAIMYLLLVCR